MASKRKRNNASASSVTFGAAALTLSGETNHTTPQTNRDSGLEKQQQQQPKKKRLGNDYPTGSEEYGKKNNANFETQRPNIFPTNGKKKFKTKRQRQQQKQQLKPPPQQHHQKSNDIDNHHSDTKRNLNDISKDGKTMESEYDPSGSDGHEGNNENKIFDDYDSSNSDGNNKRYLFLEEQVKIHEATLRAWRQRRDVILAKKEAALGKKRELMDLRVKLIERQTNLEASRAKHLVLQAELQESLAMSRERLRRLMMLENDEEEKSNETDTDTLKKQESVATVEESPDAAREDSRNDATGTESDGITMQMLPPPSEKKSPPTDVQQSQFSMVFNSYQTAKELARYHSRREDSRSHRSLSAFMPEIDATRVEEYLNLLLRETYTLDHETNGSDADGRNNNKQRSLRRQLFENTCLDVLLLAPPDEKNDGRNLNPAAYSDATPQIFDATISLCPYELGGTCADDLCPYQHTTKATKLLARERLPLPSLPASILLREEIPNKSENKTKNKKPGPTPYQVEEGIIQKPPRDSEYHYHDREANISNQSNSAMEEDFIMLPDCDDNADNNDDNENETASSDSDRSSLNDSDDELLPLSEPSTRKALLDKNSTEAGSFWWGGQFPMYQNRNGEKVPKTKDAKITESSILDILQEVFGLALQEHSDTTIKGTQNGPFSSDKGLEIKITLPSEVKNPDDSELHDELTIFGRILDASRLALHGGLHGMAISLSTELLKSNVLKDEPLKHFAYLMFVQIEFSQFYDHATPSMSCFEVAFSTQVALSIVSWSVAAYGRAERKQKGENHLLASLLNWACGNCWDLLRNPTRKTCHMKMFEPLDTAQLRKCLRNDHFDEASQIEIGDIIYSLAQNGSDRSGIENDVIHAVGDVRSMILWAQRHSIPLVDEFHISDQSLQERLNSIWYVAKNSLKEYGQGKPPNQNKTSAAGIDDLLDRELQCLKVVILMGYTIFGCFSNLARSTATTTQQSAGYLAAWTLLDGTIARVLKEMRRSLAGFPLLDVVLAPLYACTVASASYIRSYSMAQNRLTECLSRNSRRSGYLSTNTMKYSELLWSQLVQLRMSLPNEATTISNPSILGTSKGNKMLPKRDTIDDFPWQPSKALQEETQQLAGKLRALDIRLRHIVLWGDWMLSSLVGKTSSSQSLVRLFSCNSHGESNKNDNSPVLPVSINWKEDLEILRSNRLGDENTATTNPLDRCFGGRLYPPPSPLPQLPLLLLHKGKFLTNLNLKGCSLDALPLTFGLCFPSLQTLDISHNNLKKLPESFSRLTTHRMKFLKEFRSSHNRLEYLPSDMLSGATTSSAGPVASGSSSKQQGSYISSLRILVLSHNNLVSVPSLAGLVHLEVLELHHNALLDMTVADWSKLVLRLPSLRLLNRGHQVENDPVSMEE